MDIDRLHGHLDERLRATGLPGAVVALVRADDPGWVRAFGLRDLERRLPATPDTLYGWGSLTKSVTAVAVLRLVESGALSLDDPVSRHVPTDWDEARAPITLEHLLSHTSGLPALGYAEHAIVAAMDGVPTAMPLAGAADVDAFARGAGRWAIAEPGRRWMYLNEGYVLLGRVVEQATGERYEDHVRRVLLEPLGLARTRFERDAIVGDADVAAAYALHGGRGPVACGFPIEGLGATGGLYGSARDLARWCRMLLRGGELDGTRLLPAARVADMAVPRATTPGRDGPYGDVLYGLGLRVQTGFLGRRLVEHAGSVGAFTSWMGWVPDAGVGAVAVTNGTGQPTLHLGAAVLAEALGVDCTTLPHARRDRVLDALCGTYRGWRDAIEWRVRRLGDLLAVDQSDRHGLRTRILVPESLDDAHARFWSLEAGVRFPAEFTTGPDGTDLVIERYRLRRAPR